MPALQIKGSGVRRVRSFVRVPTWLVPGSANPAWLIGGKQWLGLRGLRGLGWYLCFSLGQNKFVRFRDA